MSDTHEIFVVYNNEKPIYFTKTERDAWEFLDNEIKYIIESEPIFYFTFSFHRYKSVLHNRFDCIILEEDYKHYGIVRLRSIYCIRKICLYGSI